MKDGYYYTIKDMEGLFSILGMSHYYPGLVMMSSTLGEVTNVLQFQFDDWCTEYNP